MKGLVSGNSHKILFVFIWRDMDGKTVLPNTKQFTQRATEYSSLGMSQFPILVTENATTILLCFLPYARESFLDYYFIIWGFTFLETSDASYNIWVTSSIWPHFE